MKAITIRTRRRSRGEAPARAKTIDRKSIHLFEYEMGGSVTPQQLRALIRNLDPEPPITVAFERKMAKTTASLRVAWYRHQKEHWLAWLKAYAGPGYYGRATWDVPARTVYNRACNPAMVLWLGEACGVPVLQVKAAKAAAVACRGSFPAQCGAIRRIIPWEVIEQRLAHTHLNGKST